MHLMIVKNKAKYCSLIYNLYPRALTDIPESRAPSTGAKMIFSPPYSLAVFHEFLRKDGLIAKKDLDVETL